MLMHDETLRPRVALRDGWRYVAGRQSQTWLSGRAPAADDAAVSLPHCWNTTDTFEAGAAYRRGWGSYRCAFPFAVEGRESLAWRLRSEGFYGTGDVWLNGARLAVVDGQYLGMDLPAGLGLRAGENVLAVRVNNRYHRHVLPGIRDPDFLLYGGLAGRVWLEGLPMVHVVDAETWVYCVSLDSRSARIVIPFTLRNLSVHGRDVRLTWRILAPDGACVAEDAVGVSLAAGLADAFAGQMQFVIPSPRPWSPATPALYVAHGELTAGGVRCDDIRIRFGCRTASFVPDQGFLLNGERLELRGVNRHESMPGFGNALPDGLHRADARQIRALGLNFVRLSHYPQHPVFLDACDELGILVYAELATWKRVSTGGWLRAARRQLEGLVTRDRHRPSIIAWGLGNEARSRRVYLDLRERLAVLDSTRAVSYAENHLHRARRRRTLGIPDVWGCNYELTELTAARDAARLRCVLVTECANYPPAERGAREEEMNQVALIAGELARLREHRYVAGFALWSFADYATLRKARFHRCCGVVDAWRVPKPAADYLRATGLTEPVLAVHGDWSADGMPLRRLTVISNMDRIRARVNGRVVDERAVSEALMPLDVPFSAGLIEIEGVRGGDTRRAQLATAGAPARLLVEADPAFATDPDVAKLWLRLEDREGHLVTHAGGWVDVALDGTGRLVTHVPRARVKLAAGVGVVYIQRREVRAPVAMRFTVGAGAAGSLVATHSLAPRS